MAGTGRLTGIDGLRGVAAVAIVVLHTWMYTGARDPRRPPLLDAAIGELRLGVTFFFVLSGFLLARPWVRAALDGGATPSLRRFAGQRAKRVLPAYWAALAGAVVVLEGTGHPRGVAVDLLPAFLLFAQNQVTAAAGQLNPPTWSLAVEVAFYAALPLLGAVLIRAATRARALAVCAAAVAVGLGWSLLGELRAWPSTATTALPTFLPVFACGIAAAIVVQGRRIGRRAAGTLAVVGALLVSADAVWHSHGTGLVGHVVRDLPAAVGFAAIVLAVTARPGRVLDSRPLRSLGTVSYGVYLWHMPVVYWLVTRDALPQAPGRAVALVTLLSVLLGAASWILVERPLLRRPGGAPHRVRPARAVAAEAP